MRVTPFECYRDYLALKQHFTTKGYDYFKYNGKIKSATPASFDGRRDKYFFQKLSKLADPHGFLVANMVETDKVWIGSLVNDQSAHEKYTNWLKRNQSLSYHFNDEMDKLMPTFDDNFRLEKGDHPFLLKLFLRKEISMETLVILVDLSGCEKYWNRMMNGDPIWDEVYLKLIKYRPFVKYDRKKIKSILLTKFDE